MSNYEGEYRSGIIAIVGNTNVGKSTLLNSIVGEKVTIVSNRVQTTRNVIRAILTKKWSISFSRYSRDSSSSR